VGIKCADLKNKFLFQLFTCYVYGKPACRRVLAQKIREIEVSSNWFGCVLILSFL